MATLESYLIHGATVQLRVMGRCRLPLFAILGIVIDHADFSNYPPHTSTAPDRGARDVAVVAGDGDVCDDAEVGRP